jgi:hypothetical protein
MGWFISSLAMVGPSDFSITSLMVVVPNISASTLSHLPEYSLTAVALALAAGYVNAYRGAGTATPPSSHLGSHLGVPL